MLGCITGAFYSMKIDVLDLQVVQNTTTNALEKKWVTVATGVKCLLEPIKTISASERSSGKHFTDIYAENDLYTLALGQRLSKRQRITNVRDSSGDIILNEIEVMGHPATEFEVIGETLIINPFGKVSQYTYMIGRVGVQNVK
jgi:hypothetical protein